MSVYNAAVVLPNAMNEAGKLWALSGLVETENDSFGSGYLLVRIYANLAVDMLVVLSERVPTIPDAIYPTWRLESRRARPLHVLGRGYMSDQTKCT